jgi:hypothetical protein
MAVAKANIEDAVLEQMSRMNEAINNQAVRFDSLMLDINGGNHPENGLCWKVAQLAVAVQNLSEVIRKLPCPEHARRLNRMNATILTALGGIAVIAFLLQLFAPAVRSALGLGG